MTTRIRPQLGESVMRCAACDTYFRGLENFDKHRRNVQGPPTHPNNLVRACVPPEVVGLHYYADKGWWGGQPMSDEDKARMKWGRP